LLPKDFISVESMRVSTQWDTSLGVVKRQCAGFAALTLFAVECRALPSVGEGL